MPEINDGVPFSTWDGSSGDAFPTDDRVGGVELVDGNVVFRSDLNEFYKFDGTPGSYALVAPAP